MVWLPCLLVVMVVVRAAEVMVVVMDDMVRVVYMAGWIDGWF